MGTSWAVSVAEIIERPQKLRPHVVLVGAGASCAAFPRGEGTGRLLPVMSNFVELVGLVPILQKARPGLELEPNIEVLYSQLYSDHESTHVVRAVEERITDYFSQMRLPETVTTYDHLVLSLRSTDSIFSFNWDPLLYDAWQRNSRVMPLPSIHFLHGCVRVSVCEDHPEELGEPADTCAVCGKELPPAQLLYPVHKKDYSSHPSIARAWSAAQSALADALNVTVFGYGAPDSDADAVDLLRAAWFERSSRSFEHLELIDIASADELEKRWRAFAPTFHFSHETAFDRSHIARWPRRVSESWFYPMSEGRPCIDFPLPATDCLRTLQDYCREISRYE